MLELQKFADETGLILQVCHYPPGTSKWNKIQHRMFCHITQTWRGKPLVSRVAVVDLIASTTTKTGLTVRCELDENSYTKAIRVTDKEMAALSPLPFATFNLTFINFLKKYCPTEAVPVSTA
ncbi:MAG: hypothetical protein B7X48_14890 [Acidiphilium sp. 34-60-192]|nr:MAG: hypothetical protein B7X48_14890 [Acidiphilium sp. 34-60-192]